ncbi:DUF2062 domain-containing protein [Paenibacillus sp. JMULE4]|nr:DUF2062 domain-containing protein [Paenibacillus sp. JMULE4]NTZ18859.1 DUF2062 domain-containing protein [Paenibacillus sp. JMULE4]
MMKWTRKWRLTLIRLLRVKSADRHVALGLVVGFVPCWLPTFGIGAILSAALARLFKASVTAALASAAVGSVLWPALFYLNYKIGGLVSLLFSRHTPAEIEIDEVEYMEAAENVQSRAQIGIDFTVGALINSVVFSVIGYYVILAILNRYRVPLLNKLRS